VAEKQIVITEAWGGAVAGQVATVADKDADELIKKGKAFPYGTKEAKEYLDKMFRAEQGVVTK
jgi:hypothetical protein